MEKKEPALTKNPTLAQQWIESIASVPQTQRASFPNIYATQQALINRQRFLVRDCSVQSDDSHCSSVESVLELRKPDPEAVLLGLGFGPKRDSSAFSRIPTRFLQPSKLITHIDINKFLEQYGDEGNIDQQSAPQSPARARAKTH